MKDYWVYILSSRTRVLYIGVTGNLTRRISSHRRAATPGFTAQYLVRRLVYAERTTDVHAALRREKQLKGWWRAKKVALIERVNSWVGGPGGWRRHVDTADAFRLRSFDCVRPAAALRSG